MRRVIHRRDAETQRKTRIKGTCVNWRRRAFSGLERRGSRERRETSCHGAWWWLRARSTHAGARPCFGLNSAPGYPSWGPLCGGHFFIDNSLPPRERPSALSAFSSNSGEGVQYPAGTNAISCLCLSLRSLLPLRPTPETARDRQPTPTLFLAFVFSLRLCVSAVNKDSKWR